MTDLDLIIRPVPQPSSMVALVDKAGVTQTSFIVHQDPKTRALKVFLFRGDPRQPWREWAAEHYPDAPEVSFERMRGDGLAAKPPLSLKPKPLPVSADPRVLLVDPDVYRWALIMIGVLLFVVVAAWGAWEAATIWADHAEQAWEQRFTTNGGGR